MADCSNYFNSEPNIITMKIKEANITINVKNLEKSVSFYESLGLQVKSRWNNDYAQLTAPGVILGLHPTDASNLKGNSGNTSIGFIANNFEEAKVLLQNLSVAITERQEEGGQFLHFYDPDGTALYFINPSW
jgi:catechol 2,3-dioxygenase-like lactoylglutathione lyase family enzyme